MTKKENDILKTILLHIQDLQKDISIIESQITSIRFAVENKSTVTTQDLKTAMERNKQYTEAAIPPTSLTQVSKGIQ